MKKLVLIVIAASLMAGVRTNREITVAAGTPVRLATSRLLVNRIFIQMKTAGTGRGYVMAGIPVGTTPASTTSAHLTAELCPATATAPGCAYTDSYPDGIDVSLIWVDGSHTGDKITVSWEVSN